MGTTAFTQYIILQTRNTESQASDCKLVSKPAVEVIGDLPEIYLKLK